MRVSNMKFLILLVPLMFTGCLFQKMELGTFKMPDFNVPSPIPTPDNKINDARGVIPKIVESLKTASKDDCLHHAKVYYGLANFLKNSKAITKTIQLAPPGGVVGNVQKDYGWEIGKNKEFTDLVAADMDSYLEIKKPRDIDDTLRAKMVETFSVYGEGCLKAAGGK